MYNYHVHLHYWLSGHVPHYTLTLVQIHVLSFVSLYMYLQETYLSCFPYAFTIPTSPGTHGQVENTQEGQHQFDVLPATASIP